MPHPRTLASLAIVSAMLLGGCASGEASGAAPLALDQLPDDAREVVATEMAFDADELRAPAGTIAFVLVNEGRLQHDLVIDGTRVAQAPPGASVAGAIELAAGTYELWCSVPGHRRAGMESTLEVTGS